jgi:AraC-like DNA-binding protein
MQHLPVQFMLSGNSISIDHSVLFAPSGHPKRNGIHTLHSAEGEFGSLISKVWQLPAITVTGISGVLRRNLHLRQHDDRECLTVNSCYVIKGKVHSKFSCTPEEFTLTKGFHSLIYEPDLMDDHFLSPEENEFSMLHVAVHRSRFVDLLCVNEGWCDELRRRIPSKQLTARIECPLTISSAMYRTLHDIMNCPITGTLEILLLEAKVLELIAHQLHQYHNVDLTTRLPMSRSDREIFSEIKLYLSNAYDKDHSLRSLARQFGINEFKLKKGFREIFGTTVFGYIHSLKMYHARNLMEECGATVSQAASRMGYKNPNHFSVAFKKQFGLSPSALRKTQVLA